MTTQQELRLIHVLADLKAEADDNPALEKLLCEFADALKEILCPEPSQ